MSIYVGDKKAKLYHGDYGPAQFYKGDVKIAGYTDVEKIGTSISGIDTYNDALNLTIEGKSEQTVTVQGKNLLDNRHVSWYSQDAIIQDGWYVAKDGYFSGVILGLFQVYSGKRYAVTFTYKSDNIGHFMISPANSTQGLFSTNISIGLITDGMVHRGKAVFTATQDVLARVWLLKKGAATIKGTSMYKDINVIEEPADSTEVPPYEPFVPNSPSPDYPAPIRSSENFDAVSCGRDTTIATTAHITDPLRSVGGMSDSIEVSDGKVEVVTRIDPAMDACTTERIDVVGVRYVLATPTRTDITAATLGQALLAMRTYPNYTQVYTNATLPPTLRAKIKEMEL